MFLSFLVLVQWLAPERSVLNKGGKNTKLLLAFKTQDANKWRPQKAPAK